MIEFDNCDPLNESSTDIWQIVTSSKILYEMRKFYNDSTDFLQVSVKKQDNFRNRKRLLLNNDGNSALRIYFSTIVKIKSSEPITKADIVQIIADTFDTEEKQVQYIYDLQKKNSSVFGSINKMIIKVSDPDDPAYPSLSSSPSSSPSRTLANPTKHNVWMNVGLSIGAIVLFFSFVCLFYYRRKWNSRTNIFVQPLPIQQRISSTIRLEDSDVEDVSTLGDPVYGSDPIMFVAPVDHQDSTTERSADSANYDYNRVYGGAAELSAGGGSKIIKGTPTNSECGGSAVSGYESGTSSASKLRDSDSLFSDDNSFERQYTEPEEQIRIIVPPGKLGVVIDTPDGIPMVHALKDTSILATKIRVGDKLVSVDGEDITAMQALHVSKMISERSQNPTRVLVFVRPRS